MLNRRPLYSAFASARRFASWHLRAQTELIFAAVQHHISDSSAPRTAPRSSQGSVCVCLPACVACRCTRIAAVGNQCLQEYPCCDQPAPPGAFQGGAACLRHYTAPRSSQGGVCACIPVPCQRSQECPKVAQHVSALHSPQEFPRWRVHVHSCSVPALPGVSQGGAACLRTQEYPKVAQHASALHSPQEFPRWRVHVHSWLCCHFSL